MGNDLYTAIWSKRLPDILDLFEGFPTHSRIILQEGIFQAVGNRQDYSFRLELLNGKVINNIGGSAVARDLVAVIHKSADAQQRLWGKHLILRFDRNFTLNIETA